ncbi:CDP-alcohol phosphatidyltransferase family protein [Candidatus Woesearchaeota archaeon]|nr:MAG: CDP-alcohol phosphatidyltransferase family protein [Candidatus Woesearchaeota archaeon]
MKTFSKTERNYYKALFSPANIITTTRLILLFVLVIFLYLNKNITNLISLGLIVIILLLDTLDGYVARKLKCETKIGSVYDIAADRIVENVLWIVFTGLGLIPIWIPIIVLTRGFITDSIRSYAMSLGKTPYKIKYSKLGGFIITSLFMRGFYGAAKAVSFFLLILIITMQNYTQVNFIAILLPYVNIATKIVVYLTVILCIIRGIPVITESKKLFIE